MFCTRKNVCSFVGKYIRYPVTMVGTTSTAVAPDDVVISGIGGTFPMSDNLDEFASNLLNHINMVEEVHQSPDWQREKLDVPYMRGVGRNRNKFDAAFFGISAAQSARMDDLLWRVMESTFEAIIDSGLNPSDLRNTNTAVLIASFLSESEMLWVMHCNEETGFSVTGINHSMFANRVSYWLNTKGMSYAYLVEETGGIKVLETAYELIKTGQCDAAIVGTINYTVLPESLVGYMGLGCLSSDGKCRSFDAKGTGYARSDACVVMYLQRAEAAKRIYATLVHAQTSYYGDKNAGLIRPIGDHMVQLLEEFYTKCGINPTHISFLEANGCALQMYEVTEFKAVSKVLLRRRESPLLIGSVKSNMGHAGAASSSCSIVKCLIAMERGVIPANLHYETPGSHIPALVEGRLKVVTENTEWNPGLVAINSVEITGACSHVLLRPYCKTKSVDSEINDKLPRLLCLSGRNEEGIKEVMAKVKDKTTNDEFARLVQDVYSSNIKNHNYRGYFLSSANTDILETQHFDGSKRPVWFVFSGMGSQWPGMATHLMKLPVISDTLQQCHNILQNKGVDLMDILTRDDPGVFDNILHSFVGIAAVQVALVETLRLLNIEPDGMIGHSVGELGCAYADGCFTMEQMILAAYYRGLASVEAELIDGRMAAVGLSFKKIKDLVPPSIDVACHNSHDSCTISGPAEDVTHFVDELKREYIFAKEVNVSNIAYHSRYIKPAAPKLLNYLRKIIPEPKPRSSRWYSTSVPEEKWDTREARYSSAEYHTNNLLNPVLFEETSKHIPKNAILIEIAPHGLLQAILKRSMGADCINVPLTQRSNDDVLEFLLSAIGKLYLAGMVPRISALYPPVQFPVSRGTPSLSSLVTWDHSITWPLRSSRKLVEPKSVTRSINLTLNDELCSVLKSYVVDGHIVLSAAAVLVLLWKELGNSISRNFKKMPVVFDDVYFYYTPIFPNNGPLHIFVSLLRTSGNFEIFEMGKDQIFVKGQVRTVEDITAEFSKKTGLDVADGIRLTSQDIYYELEDRGFEYGEQFRKIREATLSNRGCKALIDATSDWVVSIDSLLQLAVLQSTENKQHLHMPMFMQKVVIDPLGDTAVGSTNAKEALFNNFTKTALCGSMEVQGIKVKGVHLERPLHVLSRTLGFIPFKQSQFKNTCEFVNRILKLLLENNYTSSGSSTITVAVLVNENSSSGFEPQVRKILQKENNFKVLVKSLSVSDDQNITYATFEDLLFVDDSTVYQGIMLLRNNGGFLLGNVSTSKYMELHNDVAVIDEQCFEDRKWIIAKKCAAVSKSTPVVVLPAIKHLKLREIFCEETSTLKYFISESYSLNEVEAFVDGITNGKINFLRSCRFVFIVDNSAPPFSPTNSFYADQLKLDLVVNIYYNGAWGSLVDSQVSHASAPTCTFFRDLSSSLRVKNLDWNIFGVNLYNLKIKKMEDDQACVVDMCGHTVDGQKVMCVAEVRPGSVQATTAPHLTWLVPDYWSMEDAATVPLVYSLAYYALVLKADARHGENILVQSGHTALGQAFISVALQRGLHVCTTVYNNKHRVYLRKKFPQIQGGKIYLNSNNVEVEMLKKTNNKGFRIVVNPPEEHDLQTSVNCVSLFGRLLQLCTTEMEHNKDFGMEPFLRNLAFIPIIPEMMFEINPVWKTRLHEMVAEGIKTGVVRPLDRAVFTVSMEHDIISTLQDSACTKKVLVTKDSYFRQQAENISRLQSSYANYKTVFSFHPDVSCLILDDAPENCLVYADWAARRGCRYITVSCNTSAMSSLVNRHLHSLRTFSNVCINLVSVEETYNLEHTVDLLHGINNTATLSAIFLLSVKDMCVKYLETALCTTELGKTTVVLTNCDIDTVKHMRKSTGLTILDLQVSRKVRGTKLRVLSRVLDELLLRKPQDTVYLTVEEKGAATELLSSEEQLPTLLPSSVQQLELLGEDLMLNTSSYLEEVCTKSPTLSHVREVHPVFIVPGLQSLAKSSAEVLARNLMCPAVVIKLPGGDENLQKNIVAIAQAMKNVQAEGPYNLVGISWCGIYTIELARQLQAEGENTRVFLLEGAPQTNQDIARLLGDGDQLQVNLLLRLLNLTASMVYKELQLLPDWRSRLHRAMSELPQKSEISKQHISFAVEALYRRIETLLCYKPDEELLSGQVVLVRPSTQTDDSCGLEKFFKESVKVVLMDSDTKCLSESTEVADMISHLALVNLHWTSHRS